MSGREGTRRVVVLAVVCLVCLAPAGAVGAGTTGGMGGQAAALQENQAATIADGEATVTGYSVPESVTLHRNFTVTATVNNTGSSEDEKTIRVERARDRLWSTIATHNVTVPANTEKTVSFNATVHVGERGTEARVRVIGLSASTIDLQENPVSLETSQDDETGLEDTQLAQGENTTVSAYLINDFGGGEFVARFEGGVYSTGRSYTEGTTMAVSEPIRSIEAYPRFDAGGVHAVTINEQFLGFVNVSSRNVTVREVGSLPGTVYEGTEHAIDVTVENTGSGTESFAVTTSQNRSSEATPGIVDTRVVTLSPGEERTVERTVRFHERGEQTLSVNNETVQTVTVEHPVTVTDYDVKDSDLYSWQEVNVTATVENRRTTNATKEVEFEIRNNSVGRFGVSLDKEVMVEVAGDSTRTITYSPIIPEAVQYNLVIDNWQLTTIDVTENPISATSLTTPDGNVSNNSVASVTVGLSNGGSVDTHRYVRLRGHSEAGIHVENVSVRAGETRNVTFSPNVVRRGWNEFFLDGNRTLNGVVSVEDPNLTLKLDSGPKHPTVDRMPPVWFSANNTGASTEKYRWQIVATHDEFDQIVFQEWWEMTLHGGESDPETWFPDPPQPGNYTVSANGETLGTWEVKRPIDQIDAGLSKNTIEVGERVWFNGTYRNPTDEYEYVPVTVPNVSFRTTDDIPPGETENVSEPLLFQEPGSYSVLVNGEQYLVTVETNESVNEPEGGDESSDNGGDGPDDGGDETNGGGGSTDNGTEETGDSDDGDSSGGASESSNSGGQSANGSSNSDVVKVKATTTTNGTMVAEASGSANETVVIEVSASNASGGNTTAGDTPDGNATAVTGVNVSLAANETFTVAVSTSEERPGTVPDGEPEPDVETVEYVDISHPELSEGEIAAASFTVAVGTERLAAMDASPDDVVVSRYDDGWERVQTTYRGERGDAHVFEVESPGLSVFAVGVDRTDSTTATDTTATTAASTTAGDSATGDGTATSATGTETDSGSSDGRSPGFGVLAAVLALLAAAAVTRAR